MVVLSDSNFSIVWTKRCRWFSRAPTSSRSFLLSSSFLLASCSNRCNSARTTSCSSRSALRRISSSFWMAIHSFIESMSASSCCFLFTRSPISRVSGLMDSSRLRKYKFIKSVISISTITVAAAKAHKLVGINSKLVMCLSLNPNSSSRKPIPFQIQFVE